VPGPYESVAGARRASPPRPRDHDGQAGDEPRRALARYTQGTMSETDRLFLECSIRRLNELVPRIEACLGKLTPEQVWARGGENENAVGNLVLHLCGNVRQWIIAGVGGRLDMRDRDGEFAARGGASTAELGARLRETVDEATAVIAALAPERLAAQLVIQGYRVSVLEAIYHVVEHFSMHTGQILFATKMLTGTDLGFYRHLAGGSQARRKALPIDKRWDRRSVFVVDQASRALVQGQTTKATAHVA